jgi:hypothetical protein
MRRRSAVRRVRRLHPMLIALGFAFTAASAAAAQIRTGVIAGVVKDELGQPVPNVEIIALKASTTLRTDSLGVFITAPLPSGQVELSFRRLPFAPVVLVMHLLPDDTTDVEVTLTVVAQKLTAVVVQADPQRFRTLEAFESRRRQGIGHFITRREIDDRHPLLLSDMMRRVPGTLLYTDQTGRVALRFSRVARNGCSPQFYVDGVQATGFAIDDMPSGDVEGIELYAGASGLPPEFNRINSTSICGTVLIWTRIPGNTRAKP